MTPSLGKVSILCASVLLLFNILLASCLFHGNPAGSRWVVDAVTEYQSAQIKPVELSRLILDITLYYQIFPLETIDLRWCSRHANPFTKHQLRITSSHSESDLITNQVRKCWTLLSGEWTDLAPGRGLWVSWDHEWWGKRAGDWQIGSQELSLDQSLVVEEKLVRHIKLSLC